MSEDKDKSEAPEDLLKATAQIFAQKAAETPVDLGDVFARTLRLLSSANLSFVAKYVLADAMTAHAAGLSERQWRAQWERGLAFSGLMLLATRAAITDLLSAGAWPWDDAVRENGEESST